MSKAQRLIGHGALSASIKHGTPDYREKLLSAGGSIDKRRKSNSASLYGGPGYDLIQTLFRRSATPLNMFGSLMQKKVVRSTL